MKIRDYLLSQKSLVRNQIEKNNKLIRELILSKSPQSFKLKKEKSVSAENNQNFIENTENSENNKTEDNSENKSLEDASKSENIQDAEIKQDEPDGIQ